MVSHLEDDKILSALKQTLQHISTQQQKYSSLDIELKQTKQTLQSERDEHFKQCNALQAELQRAQSLYQQQTQDTLDLKHATLQLQQQTSNEELQRRLLSIQFTQCQRHQQQCKHLRVNLTDIAGAVLAQKQEIATEFEVLLQHLQIRQRHDQSCERKTSRLKWQYSSIRHNITSTKSVLQSLRRDISNELHSFERDLKAMQRSIFRQKSMLAKEITRERHKTAQLEQTLNDQMMENEQNMELKLHAYLRQKDELQQKINGLESYLKDKNGAELVTQMKRFRSAAIITSVTALPDDGQEEISYHQLSEHERHAIQLKGKLERKIHSQRTVNITEKVDEFVRGGGLRRFPVMESEFVFVSDLEGEARNLNRFRFGTKYIDIQYHAKHNQLCVNKENETMLASPVVLQDWIQKNAAIEMRKKLLKVSQRKKQNKLNAV